jgi:hypothetical protein
MKNWSLIAEKFSSQATIFGYSNVSSTFIWFFFINVKSPALCVDLPIPGPPKKLIITLITKI